MPKTRITIAFIPPAKNGIAREAGHASESWRALVSGVFSGNRGWYGGKWLMQLNKIAGFDAALTFQFGTATGKRIPIRHLGEDSRRRWCGVH